MYYIEIKERKVRQSQGKRIKHQKGKEKEAIRSKEITLGHKGQEDGLR